VEDPVLRTITLCLALLVALPSDAASSRENAHVRPVHPELAKLIEEGAAQSATLRSLIEQLQRTDVVALIEFDNLNLPSDLAGGLRFITKAGSLRLLRVSIRRTLSRRLMLVTIGHELQHALEIAAAPQVVDEESLHAFYRKLDRGSPADRFDTNGARRAGDFVDMDLQAKRVESTVPTGPFGRNATQRRAR
jgi:hypothetical protein